MISFLHEQNTLISVVDYHDQGYYERRSLYVLFEGSKCNPFRSVKKPSFPTLKFETRPRGPMIMLCNTFLRSTELLAHGT